MDLNAKKAAVRAGYSAATAEQQGSRLLSNVKVRTAVEDALRAREERVQADSDWVLRRLIAEAEADLADLFDERGDLKPVGEWPLIWRQGLVQGVEVEQEKDKDGDVVGFVRKVKLDNRVKRMELIGKHVRVNASQEQVKVSGLDGLAECIARAKARDG